MRTKAHDGSFFYKKFTVLFKKWQHKKYILNTEKDACNDGWVQTLDKKGMRVIAPGDYYQPGYSSAISSFFRKMISG